MSDPATRSNNLYEAVDGGVQALVPFPFFVHTPVANIELMDLALPTDLEIIRMDVTPGDCGSGDSSTIDILDDTVSVFDSIPTIANDATNGTTQYFYPDPDLAEVAIGSVLKLYFAAGATAAANFSITVWAVTKRHLNSS